MNLLIVFRLKPQWHFTVSVILLSGLLSSCSVFEKTPEPTTSTLPEKDTQPPKIHLNGGDLIIERHQYFTDPGATAMDDFDGRVAGKVTGKIKTYALGEHSLTYTATDKAGHKASVQRLVTIVPASTVPPLNDTGVNWAASYPEGNAETCQGELADQQDCAHGRNQLYFTKLDAQGRALPKHAKHWSCIKDNHTGLIWEVKTAKATGTDLHSREDQFNWRNLMWATNGGATGYRNHDGKICTGFVAGKEMTYCNTHAFAYRVNQQGLCGFHDWRLPNLQELETLMSLDNSRLMIQRQFFPNTRKGAYWSSTPTAFDKSYSWHLDFSSGRDGISARKDELYVRLVRTARPGEAHAD